MSAVNKATPDTQPKAPAWLQHLLYMAAQRLAMEGDSVCEFKAHAGSAEEATYQARLLLDPHAATAAVYVHHKATGICVCSSVPAIVDALDESRWETNLSNPLEAHAARRGLCEVSL